MNHPYLRALSFSDEFAADKPVAKPYCANVSYRASRLAVQRRTARSRKSSA
jgi:hypothetical protein